MGISVSDGDWGIVGGTGEFAMAQGVISKKLFKQIETGNIVELNIYAIYPAKVLVCGIHYICVPLTLCIMCFILILESLG
jgi:hypothetical protein